jgi:hypothetical protein
MPEWNDELKALSQAGIPEALRKAERYRLLNEPREAESICLDVLEIDPGNQEALVSLLLALTDQFGPGNSALVDEARQLLPRLSSEYERAYYAGVLLERRAKARLRQGGPGSGAIAYEWLREAMGWYERAEALRPEGNDDAILRWNTCVRMIAKDPHVRPAVEEWTETMLE